MLLYEFNNMVIGARENSPSRLNNCQAWIYPYESRADKFMIATPHDRILAKNATVLVSYNTPIMCRGIDSENNTFVILFPYCQGGSVSATTAQHISKYCKRVGIPFMDIHYRKNPEKYTKDTGIKVYTWY